MHYLVLYYIYACVSKHILRQRQRCVYSSWKFVIKSAASSTAANEIDCNVQSRNELLTATAVVYEFSFSRFTELANESFSPPPLIVALGSRAGHKKICSSSKFIAYTNARVIIIDQVFRPLETIPEKSIADRQP